MLSTTLLVASLLAPHGPKFPEPPPPPPPVPGEPDPGGRPPSGRTPPGRTPGAPGVPPGGGPQTPTPASKGPGTANPGGLPGQLTPGAGPGVDHLSWRLWWRFNGAEWLRLKQAVHQPSTTTLDDWMGLGEGERVDRAGLAPSAEQLDRISAALIAALGRERADDALSGALVALAKLGRRTGDPARAYVARFEALLAHASQEVSETAALALGLSGEPAGIPLLRALAADDERGRGALGGGHVPLRTRAFALYGLGLAAASLPPGPRAQRVALDLIQVFEAPPGSTHDLEVAALLALAMVPLDPRPMAPPRDGDGIPIEGAQHVLSSRTLIVWLAERLEARDLDHRVRAHGLTALARLAAQGEHGLVAAVTPLVLAPLERGARAPSEVRQSAILALGLLADCDDDPHDAAARAALRRALSDGQPPERRFALMALARTGARDGQGETAGRARGEVRGALIEVLARGRSGLRPWAGLALGVMGRVRLERGAKLDAVVTRALRDALGRERSPEPLLAYALALGLRRDVQAKGLILAGFDRVDDPTLGGELALALGLLGEPSVGPVLRERLARAKYRPRELERTAVALALLGDKQAATTLAEMLAQARSLGSQAAVAQALGAVGDARTLDPLLALLADQEATASARAFAAVGLGDLADRRGLPWSLPLGRGLGYRALTSTLVGDGRGVLDLR